MSNSIKSALLHAFLLTYVFPGSAGEKFGKLPHAHVLLRLGACLYREVISK